MKNETNQPKKTRLKGFYTALLVSLAMIGAACAYAYQATNAKLESDLNSLQKDLSASTGSSTYSSAAMTEDASEATTIHRAYDAVADVKPETSITVQTETPVETQTELSSEPEDAAELDHVIVIPIEGEIQAEFSCGELVKSETTGTWQTHNGADIAAEDGSAVCAIDNGTVSEVTRDALWGVCVAIDHGNGIVSRYCGLSGSLSVKEGDAVESGQTIGTIGNTADIESKQESHLHFEVLKNDIYVDPIAFVNE
ncbi:MAG: M23 family metallopeptidase [Ruminococcus sp.]|nr:M23 family metallopeptidase [Ruminococcus sp.]